MLKEYNAKKIRFILEDTTNSSIEQQGFVGQLFETTVTPKVGSRLELKLVNKKSIFNVFSKAKGFAISIKEIEDLCWAGLLNDRKLMDFMDSTGFGFGTRVKSKNSNYVLRLVEVI